MVCHVCIHPVDVAEFVPDYRRVADDIIGMIRDGRLHPGDKLPTRRELGDKYEVSQQTIASALMILQASGWTRGHQGKGVYVSDQPPIGTV